MARPEYKLIFSDKNNIFISSIPLLNYDALTAPHTKQLNDTLPAEVFKELDYLYKYNIKIGFIPIYYNFEDMDDKITLWECEDYPLYEIKQQNKVYDLDYNFHLVKDEIDKEYKKQMTNKTVRTKKLKDIFKEIDEDFNKYMFRAMKDTGLKAVIANYFKNYINKKLDELKQKSLQNTKERQEEKLKEHNEEQAKERERRLIDDHKIQQERNKIYRETTKQLDKLDWEFVPELTEERFNLNQRQKEKPKETKNLTLTYSTAPNPPYRSEFKLKHIYKDGDYRKLDIDKLNSFNIKKSSKKYNLKACSTVRYTFIGDLFFQGRTFAYLLLINVNTRKAYFYTLNNNKPIITVDVDKGITTEVYENMTKEILKDTNKLIKAFESILKQTNINVLEFDGEKAISSKEFENQILNKHNIKLIQFKSGSHTSTAIIDRLCRTIRDVAANMNYEVITPDILKRIIEIYNNAPHKTLTKILFKANPNLKKLFENGITPNDVEENEALETLFVKECLKCNALIKSQDDYILEIGQPVRIYNKNIDDKVFPTGINKANKRSVLSKEIYIVKGYKGNLIQLQGPKNEIIYKPRKDLQKVEPKPQILTYDKNKEFVF